MTERRARLLRELGFCPCTTSDSFTTDEGIEVCSACDGRIPSPSDRLLLRIHDQNALLIALQRREPEAPAPTSNGWIPDDADKVLSPKELAPLIGKSVTWVYENAELLGGFKLRDGPKARWGFYLDRTRAVLVARGAGSQPEPKQPAPRRRRRRSADVELLPVKGRR